jgi:hypothetical protein
VVDQSRVIVIEGVSNHVEGDVKDEFGRIWSADAEDVTVVLISTSAGTAGQ